MPFYRAHHLPNRIGWTSTKNLDDRTFPWNPSTNEIKVWLGPVCPYANMTKVSIPADAIVATQGVFTFTDTDRHYTLGFDLKVYTVVVTHKVDILERNCSDEIKCYESRVIAHFDTACNVIIPDQKQYIVKLGPHGNNRVVEFDPNIGIPCVDTDVENIKHMENVYAVELTPETIAIKWRDVIEFNEVVLVKRIEA